MTIVRLPDLWLKIEMVRAMVPSGSPMGYVQNGAFARCVRGNTARATTFNQWIAGDNALRLADDVHFLAATLECLVTQGIKRNADTKNYEWDRAVIEKYIQSCPDGIVLGEPLLGTFGDFGAGLLDVVSQRSDYDSQSGRTHFEQVLDGVIRKALVDALPTCTDPIGEVEVLHGETRYWLERLARRPRREETPIPENHFIQFVVPGYFANQMVFGFELRTDANLACAKWEDTGGWFAPRAQFAGKPTFILDEPLDDADAYRAQVPGDYLVQVAGIDMSGEPELPHDIRRLTEKRPIGWPEGYAEAMAFLTYAKRRARNVVKAENKKEPVLPRLRLYRSSYRVIEGEF